MKRKTIGVLAIVGLIVTAVFAGTAAANAVAWIGAHKGDGDRIHEFETTWDVYARGYLGFYSWHSSDPYGGRIYVVNHSDNWSNGTLLDDVSGGYETVSWGSYGSFYNILTWPTPLDPGRYDLILDLNVTGHNGVWTNITNTLGYGPPYLVDPIWYFNVTGPLGPEITIEKTASTNGACPGSDSLSVHIGDTVTYCFNVTNTGDVTLTNLSVIDDHYGRIALVTDSLNPGASATTKSITHTVTESDIPSVTNTATVNATDPDNKPVNDTDSCTIYIAQPPPPPTQVPALTPIGVLALVCLLSVVTVIRIKRRN